MSDSKGTGCLKGLAYGCGGCILLCIVLAVGTWASWGTLREIGPFKRVRETFETVKSEATQMVAVRSALQERFPAKLITLSADVRSNNDVTTKTLVVVIVDPEFELGGGDGGRHAKGREVAGAVVELYPTIERYDRLRLTIATSGDGSTDLGSSSTDEFSVSELLAKGRAGAPNMAP